MVFADQQNKMTNIRWRILAVLFFASTVNYIDRNVLSFVMTNAQFKADILGMAPGHALDEVANAHFKEVLGYVAACFKFAYALGFLLAGWLMDRLGVRLGFAISIVVWTLASVMQGFVGTAKGLGLSRMALGVGESGNFPASIKIPVLMVAAGRDTIVSTPVIEDFAPRMKLGTLVLIGPSKHEILQESDDIRGRFWASFDAYVDAIKAAA